VRSILFDDGRVGSLDEAMALKRAIAAAASNAIAAP
jgi:hypothetical protein